MENSSIVKKFESSTPFMTKVVQDFNQLMEYSTSLSKINNLPDHLNGKPDLIMFVIQTGLEIGLSPTQALQFIVPVKGIMSIKGDGAKMLILQSGLCKKWEEESTGSIDDETYSVTITTERINPNIKQSNTYSVADAKRAGLWITESQIKKEPKYKYSAWYKYPKRMIKYRCLGFIARDVYMDVLGGKVITEEANDYDNYEVQDVKLDNETTLKIPNKSKEISNEISEKILNKAKSKNVKKQNETVKNSEQEIEDGEIVEETVEEIIQEAKTNENTESDEISKWDILYGFLDDESPIEINDFDFEDSEIEELHTFWQAYCETKAIQLNKLPPFEKTIDGIKGFITNRELGKEAFSLYLYNKFKDTEHSTNTSIKKIVEKFDKTSKDATETKPKDDPIINELIEIADNNKGAVRLAKVIKFFNENCVPNYQSKLGASVSISGLAKTGKTESIVANFMKVRK